MRIAIIGAGNVGGALGKGWARAGHKILYGVPDPDDPKHVAAARGAGAEIGPVGKAAAGADVVVLAVQWSVLADAVAACGDLSGRVVIDVTNPIRYTDHGMELGIGFDISAGEQVAGLAPGARVVKTLNQAGFDVLLDATGYPAPPVQFVAADDEEGKQLASRLVRDLGFEPVDGGGLKTARLLEPMAMLWIDQVYGRGAPRRSALAFMQA
jgi:predicted dinucleotide-binding enzyme